MKASFTFSGTPKNYITSRMPDLPILFFNPIALRNRLDVFRKGFPGLVTYAVKANDAPEVLENLCIAGLQTFDVASPAEIMQVREMCPDATLHYNNPVRSICEIQLGIKAGVTSWSVDCMSELDKLIQTGVRGEIAVRLHLPMGGSAYNFGEKFGARPDDAVKLLRRVAAAGCQAAMTFHVGTQCTDCSAWEQYITACRDIALRANVSLIRLNVGGGFPAHRNNFAPDLPSVFSSISEASRSIFHAAVPPLVCEPGRALVSECYQLLVRVKGKKIGNILYLNDGIYGAMAEWRDIGPIERLEVIRPSGGTITSPCADFTVFGPTCDSLDRLPGSIALPRAIQDGDYILISGMGAYSNATCTRFNGYGAVECVTITP
jgi:ornithine decarboxylase|tara:strand:- start:123 stop:1250 length:1128 start_codon:yes stop_codon:yes gene_type:complete